MTHLEIDVRHSTSDIRHPAARIRDSPPSILHPAFCIAALAAVAASAASLPAGYTQYSYIESTGTQYIDTGIVPTTATRVISDFRLTEIPSAPIRNGWASAGSKEAFWFGIDNDHVCFSAAVSGNSLRADTGVPVDTSRHTFDISIGGVFFDGYGIANPGSPFTNAGSGKTMYLFASRQGWTPNIEKFAKMELYSCQIYSGVMLVRDFVPCTDGNGKPGLYDTVDGQMHYNNRASGADFLFGMEETPLWTLSVAQTNGVWYATTPLKWGSGEVSLHVVSPQGATNVVALSNGIATAPATFTCTIPGLAADTAYSVFASLTSGAYTNFTRAANIFNGPVSVVATADATPTSAGVFTVSRPAADGATNAPLAVAFALSGTAVAGTHYAPIPSSVTIPAGAASATVQITTIKEVTTTTALTLTLSCETHLPDDPSSATMSVTTIRAPAALVWAAGTSATELTDVANWTPSVPAFEADDTLSFTGDGTSAYRFTMTNDMAVKSFTVANGTSSAVIDLGGHTFSNETASSGSFKQTGTGALALLNGQIDARTFSFQTATLAATNFVLNGNKEFNTTTLTLSRDRARYLLDNVKIDLCTTYYGKLAFTGWDYEIDARNVVYPDPSRVPNLTFSGTNATARFNGSQTYLYGSMVINGKNNRVSVADGRFYRAGASSYGGLTISGEGHELLVTNSEAGTCASYIPNTAGARLCVVRIAKGGKYTVTRMDDGLDKTHSFEGTSNLFEVVGGTLTLATLRLGYVEGAGGSGGNTLAVRGDDSVVTSGNGFYVGNTNKLPVRLAFQPGTAGFGGTAPIRLTGSGKNVRIAANTVFEVDARTLTQTRDHGRFALQLISFRSNTQAEAAFDAEALATFNKTLVSKPKGGTLSLETDGNYRVLTWNYAKCGTVLMLR